MGSVQEYIETSSAIYSSFLAVRVDFFVAVSTISIAIDFNFLFS